MTTPSIPSHSNPFRVSKAVNLTDREIADTFVRSRVIAERVSPNSRTPVVLLGGKGSGRTHLMRYWSLPVQVLRSSETLPGALKRDGYVGTYILMGGLNAARFAGLKLEPEATRLAFGYYFDLQISSAFCHTLTRLRDQDVVTAEEEGAFCQEAGELLDSSVDRPRSLPELLDRISRVRRAVDQEVNSATLEQRVPVLSIQSNPGDLFFGFPSLASRFASQLSGLTLTYLLDELENLDTDQQRYVQTLIRERRDPVGLIVAGRTYGVRTYETLAAGEINREGAELDKVRLDDVMREDEREFQSFCEALVRLRLEAAGMSNIDLPRMLVEEQVGKYGELLGLPTEAPGESPALRRLATQLTTHASSTRLVDPVSDAQSICARLAEPHRPLLEKAAVLAFYQDWNADRNLNASATALREAMDARGGRDRLSRLLGHFRADLLAQLRREHRRPQEYSGFTTMVDLADGNARNFVNLMKSVVSWCEFMGADISVASDIPVEAQRRAVLDTSDWFYGDAQVVGRTSDRARVGLERLCEMFEKLRFSDKPVESSLSAFNVDLDALTQEARAAVEAAADWSLLVARYPRRDRNEDRLQRTYQVNRMLAPRWNLPIARRGVVDLSAGEIGAMFGAEIREAFEVALAYRLARMNAPFQAMKGDLSDGTAQQSLL